MSDAIVIDGVTKRYRRHVALDDVSLTVPAGEVVGLIGPNGAGKTTLLKALVGLRRVDAGEIRLLGAAPGDDAARADVGVLIDEPGLWSHLSGLEHVRVHARLRGVPAAWGEEALSLVGLSDAGRKRVKAYSLGMRWRLGIAIALTSRPRILVLDEPTNGLDPIGVREMRRLLADLAGSGVSILVSSHNLTEIAHVCTRLVVLVGGRVRFRGRTEELACGGDLEEAFFALVAETEPSVV